MPGRLLDVFNRVSRSESIKSQHSDGSSTGKGAKKVSFDKKLKVKPFKPRKKKKQRTVASAPLPPKSDGQSAVGNSKTDPSTSTVSSSQTARVTQGTQRANEKSVAPIPSGGLSRFYVCRPPKDEINTDRQESKTVKKSPSPKMHSSTTAAYNYNLDPSLHPSQLPSQVPRVQRNLVRSIVAQFNEEAKKRGTSRQTSLDASLSDEHSSGSPVLIDTSQDGTGKRREPFSYTTPSTLGPRCKSDYNIQAPNDLIYAQVVVNGQKANGRHKTTIHTKVPNRAAATKTTTATMVDSKKHFSKSTGNLVANDVEDSRVLNYQLRDNKKTDNSYYKFDPVDEEGLVRTSLDKAKDARHRHQRNGKQYLRSSSLGVESDGDDSLFEPSRHHLIQLQDTNGLMKKGPGDYATRNVEKWSENEVGPNSKKFTEHEYVHEVSMSKNDSRDLTANKNLMNRMSPIYGTPLKLGSTTTRENSGGKSKEWAYSTEKSNSLLRDKKNRLQHKERSRTPTSEWRSKKSTSKENLSSTINTERLAKPAAQYYFGEQETTKSPRASPRLGRVLEVPGFREQRHNSSDSGSGIGLLSSKLVKKADAEVNGYADDPFDSAEEFENRHFRHNGNSNFGSRDKLASTWMSRRDSDNGIDGLKSRGYSTEQRRVFRKEEKEHVTKHETRTTRRPPSADGNVSSMERRKALKQRDRSISASPDRELRQANLTKAEESYWNTDAKTTSLRKEPKTTERRVDIEIDEKRSRNRRHHRHHSHTTHSGGAFGDDYDDKMETSESEPQLYGGSQDSHMSLGSRLSSVEDEERRNHNERVTTGDIIAAHVNTPQSMLKQMNKKQISYENSQHHQEARDTETTGRRLWFERAGTDEVDDLLHSQTNIGRHDANRNLYRNNNQQWTSATMSRVETDKNRRNNRNDEHHLTVNTVDRRDMRRRKGDDIRIQLNDRDVSHDAITNGKGVGRNSSFNSRVGSYHSENESQHSAGSSTSNKKRVNFKKSAGRNGFGSRSDLSPIHREALLRSASPARAPSTTGSMKSNDSDASHASNRSIILHATAVADIPPARGYRYRSANTSPAPPSVASTNGGRESRTVQRSFSLLSPWKPRKYKDKYENKKENPKYASHEFENGRRRSYHEEQQSQLSKQQQQRKDGGGNLSHNSSSERLDSLSPLASESPPTRPKGKKKTGILRRHSMPKDSRFANFFRRKKS